MKKRYFNIGIYFVVVLILIMTYVLYKKYMIFPYSMKVTKFLIIIGVLNLIFIKRFNKGVFTYVFLIILLLFDILAYFFPNSFFYNFIFF